jgi:hypothetical protein
MSKICGEINIEFDTYNNCTEEQFIKLKRIINQSLDDWFDDILDECGIESQEIHSVLLFSLYKEDKQ